MLSISRKTQTVYILMDLVFMLISFFVPYLFRYNSVSTLPTEIRLPYLAEYCFIYALWSVFIIIAFKKKHLYRTDRDLSISEELMQVISYVFYTGIMVGSIVFFAKYKFFSRHVFLASFFSLGVFLGGWRVAKRLILRKLIKDGFRNINILIVGANEVGKMVLEEIQNLPYWGFKMVGFLDDQKENFADSIPVLGKLVDFTEIAKKYFVEEVVIAMPQKEKVVSKLIDEAQQMRLGVRVAPEYLEYSLPVLNVSYIGTIPLLTYQERRLHPSEAVLKRLFDLIISAALIVLTIPLFVIIAILIKIDSSGPVFFTQKRNGLKGKTFTFYKFRSMVKNADELKHQLLKDNEAKEGIIFKIKKDPRVTRVGRFLRKYSLDELPQLLNVLKGEMSLVGPRPPLPNEIREYDSVHMDRLSIKPGMTGLSQVRGRSNLSFSRWVKWDLWYLNNWSFWLDIRILLWTIPAVFKGKGAF